MLHKNVLVKQPTTYTVNPGALQEMLVMKLQQGECEMGENVTEALESATGWNVKDGVPLLIRW